MRIPMLAALLLLLFFSCNQSDYKSDAKVPIVVTSPTVAADSSTASPADGLAKYEPVSPGNAGQPHPPQTAPQANPDWDRKIVKTADLTVETRSFARLTERIHRLVRENGGYIAQEEQTRIASRIDDDISIKIPVDRFEDFVQQIPADSDQVMDKKVTSQDVSMEVVDIKSRLETKKEVRDRYLALLRQAHNTQEILTTQQEVDGIQQELEAAAGRVNFLSHAAVFSTVHLKSFQILNPNGIETPSPQPTFLHKIKLSFLVGWEALSSLLLGLMTVWPIWLALGGGVAVWRRYQSRTTKKPA